MDLSEPINTNRGDYVRPSGTARIYVVRAHGSLHVVARNLKGPNLRLAYSQNEKIKVGLYCGKTVKDWIYELTMAEWDESVIDTIANFKTGKILKARYVYEEDRAPSTPACLGCDRAFNQSEIAL